MRALTTILAINIVLAYSLLAIGYFEPHAVLSLDDLRSVYEKGIEMAESIPPGPQGFGSYVVLQLQGVGTSVFLAVATIVTSFADVSIDAMLRGVYLALNPVTPVGAAIELGIAELSNVITLSAASAIGVELWKTLLLRARPSKWLLAELVAMVLLGLAIQCIYIPLLNAFMP